MPQILALPRTALPPLPLQGWRFRLIFNTPGIFPDGWQAPCVPGSLVAAPVGSVYWYQLQAGKLADLEKLKQLADNGLPVDDPMRRAEGFNHCQIAPWAEEN